MKPLLETKELGPGHLSASELGAQWTPFLYAGWTCGHVLSQWRETKTAGIQKLSLWPSAQWLTVSSLEIPHVDAQTHPAGRDHNIAKLTGQIHHDTNDPNGISPMTKTSPLTKELCSHQNTVVKKYIWLEYCQTWGIWLHGIMFSLHNAHFLHLSKSQMQLHGSITIGV